MNSINTFISVYSSQSSTKPTYREESLYIMVKVLDCKLIVSKFNSSQVILYIYWPSGLSVRQWSGRLGFNPRSRHTEDFKDGT